MYYWPTLVASLVTTLPLLLNTATAKEHELKVASQCFRDHGLSFVSLYCGFQRVIEIQQAFHGTHRQHSTDCIKLAQDCTTDQTDAYDWSKCNGRHTCVLMATSTEAPLCGKNKNQRGYFQVEYACLPGEEGTSTSSTESVTEVAGDTTQGLAEQDTVNVLEKTPVNICQNQTLVSHVVQVTSPGYPNKLPGNKDCHCDVTGASGRHMMLHISDVSLGMHQGMCHDWLRVDLAANSGTATTMADKLVACGYVRGSGQRALKLMRHRVALTFHSARGMHPTSLHGFSIHLAAESDSELQVTCYEAVPLPVFNSTDGSGAASQPRMVLAPTDLNSLPEHRQHPHSANQQSGSGAVGRHTGNTCWFSLLCVLVISTAAAPHWMQLST